VAIPVSTATASEVVAIIRQELSIVPFPLELREAVQITDVTLTTGKSLDTPAQVRALTHLYR